MPVYVILKFMRGLTTPLYASSSKTDIANKITQLARDGWNIGKNSNLSYYQVSGDSVTEVDVTFFITELAGVQKQS